MSCFMQFSKLSQSTCDASGKRFSFANEGLSSQTYTSNPLFAANSHTGSAM